MSARTGRLRHSLPFLTVAHLWALAVLVAVLISSSLSPIALGDFWWHLRLGQVIFSTGQIPDVDTFSLTAQGAPFVYQQWLGELYLYLLHATGGLELVVLANALALTAVCGLTLLAAWEASRNLRVASACTMIGMLVALSNRDVRPQVLGFLLFATFCLVLRRSQMGTLVHLWILPVLATIWVNIHGSFVLGFLLCGLVFAGEAARFLFPPNPLRSLPRKKLLYLGLVTATLPLTMLLNPRGTEIFGYLIGIQRNPIIQSFVTEWAPPSLHNPGDLPFFLTLFACAALFALSPKSLRLTDILVFLVFSAMALQAGRNSVWFGIVAAPIAAGQVTAISERWRNYAKSRISTRRTIDQATPIRSGEPYRPLGTAVPSYVLALSLLVLATMTIPWVKVNGPLPARYRGLTTEDTPVRAVQFVHERLAGERVFHSDGYGSYMIFAAPSQPLVFVDTRIELYSEETWDDYMSISAGRDWERRLRKYGIEYVLLPARYEGSFQAPLLRALDSSPNWKPIYRDSIATVYSMRAE